MAVNVFETALNGFQTHSDQTIVANFPEISRLVDQGYKLQFKSEDDTLRLIKSKEVSKLSLNDLTDYAKFLDTTAYDNYRDVRDNEQWKKLYDIKLRNLLYKDGTAIREKEVESFACNNCGYILPFLNITVDHQQPKKRNKWEAILKVFRAMSLTNEGAKGFKGKNIFSLINNNEALKSTKSIDFAKESVGDSDERYTLNLEGVIVYSFFRHLTSENTMKERCVHNMCNLAPLCSSCNPSKGG